MSMIHTSNKYATYVATDHCIATLCYDLLITLLGCYLVCRILWKFITFPAKHCEK